MLKNLARLVIVALVAVNLSLVGLGIPSTEASFCNDLEGEFAGFLDCDDSFTSFTDFDGGLTTPDSEGFDSSLTQAQDARTFAKNIANFALGFLGLIAVMIIIYSGYQYVIAAGDEEKMNKGKSGITSALIGIVIILSSFAIVNTVLQAPGGNSQNIQSPNGTGLTSQGTNDEQIATFNIAAEEVADLTRDFIETYEKFNSQESRLFKLTAYTPNEFTSRQDFVDYLVKMKSELEDLQVQSGALSYTNLSAQQTIDLIINPALQEIGEQIKTENRTKILETELEGGLKNWYDDIASSINDGVIEFLGIGGGEADTEANLFRLFECSLPPEERGINYSADSCNNVTNNISSTDLGTEIDNAFDEVIINVVLNKGVYRDYDSKLFTYADRLWSIKASIVTQNTSSSSSTDIEESIDEVLKMLTGYSDVNSLPTQSSQADIHADYDNNVRAVNAGNFADFMETSDSFLELADNNDDNFNNLEKIKDFILKLQNLYKVLQTVQFTNPIIDVNTARGAAPLVVTFDASRSYNPAKITPNKDMYKWDINGDGTFQDTNNSLAGAGINCDNLEGEDIAEEAVSSTVTCTFQNPGNYTVGLQLDPYPDLNSEENPNKRIYPGLAYINIQVTPPVSKIDLTADVGDGETVVLRRYDESRISEEVNELNVSLKEIQNNPIRFDASDTQGNKPLSFDWYFQDFNTQASGTGQKTAEVQYTKRGSYEALLTVTDAQSNQDRKRFIINVQDIVARIQASTTQGIPGTEIEFDASGSVSDGGAISSYIWKVDGNEVDGNNKETFKYTFEDPGEYNVSVTVSDASNEAESSVSVVITSQDPQAIFSASFPKKNQPSLVLLNGDQSYDPDPKDELIYKWTIYNAREGVDYELIEGTLEESEDPYLSLLFYKLESYKVDLKVYDPHGKTSVASQYVAIDSLVDIAFAETQEFAAQLDDTFQADINFNLESKFGDTLDINFGDGESATERFSGGSLSLEHTYTRAGAYEVVATAKKGDDQNTIKDTIIIGGGDKPIAVPSVTVDSVTYTDLAELPIIYRNDEVKFDASKSISPDGTNNGLSYQWDFGDGYDSTSVNPTHTFKELPPSDTGKFKVSLEVSKNGASDIKNFFIEVQESKPEAKSLLATTVGTKTTPIQVELEVIGPEDKDGRIVKYRYYYFPINDTDREFGVVESGAPTATLTVDTFGLEGEEIEYAFCVELTDDDGNLVSCEELFEGDKLPTIVAVNGPNMPPTANFTVSDTLVNVGESINFTAQASDPDGRIVEYVYDFDGDGSFVNNTKSDTGYVSHVYNKRSPEAGYPVKLRVLDDKGATAQSDTINIIVTGTLDEPVAAFLYDVQANGLVKFTDNSTVDTEKGGSIVEYKWDFNLDVDTDGDGLTDNDLDSDEANPNWTYEENGYYRVGMKIEDSEGNQDDVIHQVTVDGLHGSAADSNSNTDSSATDSEGINPIDLNNSDVKQNLQLIKSYPALNTDTGEIYLQGPSGRVSLSFNEIDLDIDKIYVDSYIFFDRDGDGIRYNDIDFVSSNPNDIYESPIYTPSDPAANQLGISVTVIDTKGDIYFDFAKIVFMANTSTAALKLDLANNIGIALYITFLLIGLAYGVSQLRPHGPENKKLL